MASPRNNKKTKKTVDNTALPFFGADTEEVEALRKLYYTVVRYIEEEDVSLTDVEEICEEVKKAIRKTKRNKN